MQKSTTGPRGTWKKFLPPDRISTISRADRAIVGTHTHTRSPAAPSLWLAKERALLGGRRAVDSTLVTIIVVIVTVAMGVEMGIEMELFWRWNRSADGIVLKMGMEMEPETQKREEHSREDEGRKEPRSMGTFPVENG
ncbi:uncharacterized protein K489DRAFT_136806 [Dissoconium aciculare CBS 342.82]|uniref:Uncharacterized protein n=1 Tax=Dissoconium aciculare CBS 342.82 TaxID=1314786 RepID=A0A6J3LTN3_9PEZI|nr:uncharacterized protein K489DRAFT_136806 [Dissoconium aciculare CBS 342.82]KAF1817982.1 hypothetical protein K489DRAFT_136806 [Dissoconium aciculare CBS 342.82]